MTSLIHQHSLALRTCGILINLLCVSYLSVTMVLVTHEVLISNMYEYF